MEATNAFGSFLQILGSMASLAAIPLSVFLYLRSREAKAGSLRRDIVRILSHQIGEGRLLSIFEIQSVIESKSREHGLRSAFVPRDAIIEDLVTDTITNPMLESHRKEQIVANLRNLHRKSAIYRLVDRYSLTPSSLAICINAEFKLQPEDEYLIEKPEKVVEPTTFEKPTKYIETISTLFAFLAGIITIISFAFSETALKEIVNSVVKNYGLLFEVFLGALSSVIAAFIVFIVSRARKMDRKSKEVVSQIKKEKDG